MSGPDAGVFGAPQLEGRGRSVGGVRAARPAGEIDPADHRLLEALHDVETVGSPGV